MLLIVILISLFINTFAKLYPPYFQDINNAESVDIKYITGDPLWVLNLSNEEWLDAKLKLGTCAEDEDFYNEFGHLIEDGRIAASFARVKKDDPENPKKMPTTSTTRSNKDIMREIMRMINKFALYTSTEPDVYLTENVDEHKPSIVLYFKGSATCLLVKQANKEWHYVLKTMLFPVWFYEPHDTFEAPLEIPKEVKYQFFNSLLRFLRIVLSYPI